MRAWVLISVALAAALGCVNVLAAEQSLAIGKLDVVVWEPDAGEAQPLPVVVFSHGIRLCATQSRFITEALAAAGYLVVAPNHRDASCGDFHLSFPDPTRLALKPAALWSDIDYRDRAEDIRAVIDALSNDERLRGKADLSRLALVGHSLGGYTVLGLGGAWPSWRLAGVKAIVALSPYSIPFRRTKGVKDLSAPVMYQGGTQDIVFTPPLKSSGGAFDGSPTPKYYVEIDGAGHYAWTDNSAVRKETIVAYTLAFLDRYVKDMPERDVLRGKQPGASAFRRLPEK